MRLGKYVLVAISAASMAGSPIVAQAADGSGAVARTGAGMEEAEGLGGNILGGGGFVIPLIVVMAVLLGFLVSTGNDTPVSP